jgi:hypothetical protein
VPRTRLLHYDRFERLVGEIRNYPEARHECGVDGTDGLTLTCMEDVSKGDHVSWKDPDTGEVRGQTVVSCVRRHTMAGAPLTEARCVNDICELFSSDVAARTFEDSHLQTIMQYILGGTRYRYSTMATGPDYGFDYKTYGQSSGSGTMARYSFEIPDTSAREALAQVVDELGAEMFVTNYGYENANGRSVLLYRRYGIMVASQDVVKARFTYGHNISSVSREVLSEEVYTAIRAIGKDGLTDTVYSTSALDLWGRPPNQYQSGLQHRVGRYTNTSCASLSDLQREATNELARVSQPQVTYTFDLEDVGALKLGDVVQVSDPTFGPAIALQGRITRISKDLNRERNGAQVVVGTTPPRYIQVAFASIANRTFTRRTS